MKTFLKQSAGRLLPPKLMSVAQLQRERMRLNPVAHKDEYLALAGELFSLEQQARALREQAAGGL